MRRRAVGIALLALGIAACDIDTDDSQRTAFVEATSPSGLPVTIELNKTKRDATTPVAQAMTYDGLCGSVSGQGDCVIFGSAEVKESDRGRTRGVMLCLTDGGKRVCESADFWSVRVFLDFDK